MSGWYVEVLLLNREVIKSDIISREEKIDSIQEYLDNLGNYNIKSYGEYDSDYTYDPYGYILEHLLDTNMSGISFVSNLGDDLHSDLLDVERTYNKLYKEKIITKDEVNALKIMLLRNYPKEMRTVFKNFKSLCSKIAYVLGDYFTDDGYIEMLKKKYNLTPEQVNRIYKYIKSKYRLREMILG